MNPYLLIGIRFSNLIRLLARNKIGNTPKQIFKILFLLHSSFWASLLSAIEKIKFKDQLDKASLPDEMLIIVGHWRTGSTYLHNLLSKDENFITPTLFHTAFPDSMLFSERYIKPVMTLFVQKHRPMDKVELGVDLPQEDEYALVRMSDGTPLEKLMFPVNGNYFLNDGNISNTGNWQDSLTIFCKKLNFRYHKKLLLKNPFHSFRVKELADLYPQAKFLCIHRHPYAVVPSTIKLWSLVGRDNNMGGKFKIPEIHEVSDVYHKMYKKIEADFGTLDNTRFCHVRYEDMEADPVNSVKKIYNRLGFQFSDDFQKKLESYIQSLGSYQKNEFNLNTEQKKVILTSLKDYMHGFNYFA